MKWWQKKWVWGYEVWDIMDVILLLAFVGLLVYIALV